MKAFNLVYSIKKLVYDRTNRDFFPVQSNLSNVEQIFLLNFEEEFKKLTVELYLTVLKEIKRYKYENVEDFIYRNHIVIFCFVFISFKLKVFPRLSNEFKISSSNKSYLFELGFNLRINQTMTISIDKEFIISTSFDDYQKLSEQSRGDFLAVSNLALGILKIPYSNLESVGKRIITLV